MSTQKETSLIRITNAGISDALENIEVRQELLDSVNEQKKEFLKEEKENNLLESQEGRKTIAKNARKFATLKVTIDKYGAGHVKKIKEEIKRYDTARKDIRDTLDGYRDETRQSLTEWENEIRKAENQIAVIREYGRNNLHMEVGYIEDEIEATSQFQLNIRMMPESKQVEATSVVEETLKRLHSLLEQAKEIAELQRQTEEQQEKIRKLSIEKAKADAKRVEELEKEKKELKKEKEREKEETKKEILTDKERIKRLENLCLELFYIAINDQPLDIKDIRRKMDEVELIYEFLIPSPF